MLFIEVFLTLVSFAIAMDSKVFHFVICWHFLV